jgi:hypothetical protein
VETVQELAGLLRHLRRREARGRGGPALTYRELAARTGWSHTIIGHYLTGRAMPATHRFDVLVRLLGATPTEQGALATARDRVEERRRRTGEVRSRWPAPRELPADVYGFTGRRAHLAELDATIAAPAAAPVVIALSGRAGVGTSALAVHWAHRVADRFPDGQLYVDLRGHGVTPEAALAGFLGGLGVDGAEVPRDPAVRAARYRTLLAERRMLVVLDNAGSAGQVRPLLPGSPSCVVVVTSRDPLAGLVARDGARRIRVEGLPPGESVELIRALADPRRDTGPAISLVLADSGDRRPLALRRACERAARTGQPLTDLLAGQTIGERPDTGPGGRRGHPA